MLSELSLTPVYRTHSTGNKHALPMFHVLNIIIACVAHATRPVGHRPAHRVAFGMNVADVLLPCCSSHRTSGGPTNWYGSLFSYKPLSPNTYTICGTHSFNHSTGTIQPRDPHQAPKHGSRYRMDGSELHGPACANSPPPPSPPPHSPPPRPPPPPSPPYRLLCPSHRHPCRRPRRRQQRRPARPSRAAPLPCVCGPRPRRAAGQCLRGSRRNLLAFSLQVLLAARLVWR